MIIIGALFVAAFLGIYIIFLPRLLFKRDILTLKFLIIEITFQNMICIVGSNFLDGRIIQLIILYKEVILYGTIVIYIIKRAKLRTYILPMVVLLGFCIPYLFIGSADMYTRLICFRQVLTPLVLIIYGCTFNLTKDNVNKLMLFIINVGVFQAIFGLIERFILGDKFWLFLHIEKYMGNKGFARWVHNNGLPGDFYSADLYELVGSLRRLVGVVADPLLTGHYLAFCIVILLFVKVYRLKKQQYWVLTILTLSLILTLSKGAILIIGIAYWYKIYRYNKDLGYICSVIPIGVVAFIISNNTFATVSTHVGGLLSSFSTIAVIGGGFGSAGNYAGLYGGKRGSSGESYIGAIIGQLGIVGFILFIFVILKLLLFLIKKDKSKSAYSVFVYIIAVVVEAFVSESAINYVGSGIAFIILGIMLAKCQDKGLNRNQYLKAKY